MKKLIILLLPLAFAAAFASPSKKLKSHNIVVPAGRLEGRITRGRNATEGQFPYQVRLRAKNRAGRYYLCGGSLINHEFVLTAAHCVRGFLEVEVLLGATDSSEAEITHVVRPQQFIIHEDYYKDGHRVNDIGLVKIPYTNYTDRIQPVKLPAVSQSYATYSGEEVIATGWGLIGDSLDNTTNTLQWARLTTIPNEVCSREAVIYHTHICTATVDGVNTCAGDSGGPLVLASTHIQIGITAFGYKKCLKSIPAVYTRITSFVEWINFHAPSL